MSLVSDMLPIPPIKVKEVTVAISMNIFSKMMFGMGLANLILMSLMDQKLSPAEILQIAQFAVQGLGSEFKLDLTDISVVHNEDGSAGIMFSKRFIDKLHFLG
jgi:hypothetical protein